MIVAIVHPSCRAPVALPLLSHPPLATLNHLPPHSFRIRCCRRPFLLLSPASLPNWPSCLIFIACVLLEHLRCSWRAWTFPLPDGSSQSLQIWTVHRQLASLAPQLDSRICQSYLVLNRILKSRVLRIPRSQDCLTKLPLLVSYGIGNSPIITLR